MKKGLLTGVVGVAGIIVGAATMGSIKGRTVDAKAEKIDKFKSYYNMLNQWLILKQEGKSLEQYFIENGYKTVAIYGMGEMGNRLYDELKDSSIELKYAVDQNAANTYSELEVFEKEDDFEDVDVMIVTAIFAFDEIEEQLNSKVDFPIISLEDVVYGV